MKSFITQYHVRNIRRSLRLRSRCNYPWLIYGMASKLAASVHGGVISVVGSIQVKSKFFILVQASLRRKLGKLRKKLSANF